VSRGTFAGARPDQPVHPGEILREDFLKPRKMSASALAQALYVPPNRIVEIASGKRAVTADTALRLSRHFGTSREFWATLQMEHDLRIAEVLLEKGPEKAKFEAIKPVVSAKILGGVK
jgi:antitoxin HigA-1